MKMTDDMGIIYQRYYGDLYRFCMSMCNNPGVTDINNRQAIGQVHFEKGQNYYSKIYYLLDEDVVNAFASYTKTGVSVEGLPTYDNKRWDFVEMFCIKKK